MNRVLLFFLVLWICPFAFSDWEQMGENRVFIEPEDGNRPRCIEHSDGKHSIVLWWKESRRYRRTIKAKLTTKPCSKWRSVLWSLRGWQELSQDQDEIFGQALSNQFHRYLRQVRFGAMQRRDLHTAKAYLDQNPIERFTLADNEQLANRFGFGFAGEVFYEWLLRQENNERADTEFAKELIATLREVQQGDHHSRLRQRTQGVAALVVMGLDWANTTDGSQPFYVENFVRGIQDQGIETHMGKHDPVGTMDKNIQTLTAQLRDLLASGKDVILFTLCKGAPEVLAALAEVVSPYLGFEREQLNLPENFGRVRGVISGSAMVGGTFYGDTAKKLLFFGPLAHVMSWMPFSGLSHWGNFGKALLSSSRKRTQRRMRSVWSQLPSDMLVLNVTGVLPDDGFLPDEVNVNAMKPFLRFNQYWGLSPGANDGFIVHPETLVPDEVTQNNHTIPFDCASHMLADGRYRDHDLQDTDVQRAAYAAMYHALLNLGELKK